MLEGTFSPGGAQLSLRSGKNLLHTTIHMKYFKFPDHLYISDELFVIHNMCC